jgi:hypothetical protein
MFIKLTAIASFFATSTFADESFGGVGVVYKLGKVLSYLTVVKQFQSNITEPLVE